MNLISEEIIPRIEVFLEARITEQHVVYNFNKELGIVESIYRNSKYGNARCTLSFCLLKERTSGKNPGIKKYLRGFTLRKLLELEPNPFSLKPQTLEICFGLVLLIYGLENGKKFLQTILDLFENHSQLMEVYSKITNNFDRHFFIMQLCTSEIHSDREFGLALLEHGSIPIVHRLK